MWIVMVPLGRILEILARLLGPSLLNATVRLESLFVHKKYSNVTGQIALKCMEHIHAEDEPFSLWILQDMPCNISFRN